MIESLVLLTIRDLIPGGVVSLSLFVWLLKFVPE